MTTGAKRPAARKEKAGAGTVRAAVASVEIKAAAEAVFKAVSDPLLLPRWAEPIKAAREKGGRIELDYRRPDRLVTCAAEVRADERSLTVDWIIHLPQETVKAYSRVVPLQERRSAFVFVLASSPMSEAQAAAEAEQAGKNVAQDMERLKSLLERSR